jgi:YHS domain-containing protein
MMLLSLVALLAFIGCSQADGDQAEHNHDQHAGHSDQANTGGSQDTPNDQPKAIENYVNAPYPLDTCVVAGGKLGSMGKPVTLVHEGREVKFCCAACEPKFKADPDKYIKKIDDGVVEQQTATYPLTTCLISGDDLGDKPINYVYENRLVRFCCEMCIDTFLKDPNTYLAKLNAAAVTAQLENYTAKSCPISGQDLGSMGKPIDMMIGHHLVRLCCAGCIEKVQENPAAAINKVYGAPEPAEAE